MAIDKDAVREHVRGLLIALGDDPDREGLKDTPDRVARMYEEVFEGMNYTNHEIAQMFDKTFEEDLTFSSENSDFVIVKDIDIFSYCEHHMALMYDMKVTVAYVPNGKVIGLSKIARIADMVSKRLQLQERIGTDIAEIMQEITGSEDVAVLIEGCHSCMTARGIKKTDAKTYTTTLRGRFQTDEMLELATLGAKVLHNRSVELAKKYGVQLVVRSSLNRAEGTVVKEETEMEGMLVSGVAVDKNAARIAIIGIKDEPGMAFKIFDLLAKKNINVDIILQSIGRDGTKDISFTVSRDQMDEAVKVLKDNAARVKAQKIEADPTVAKLSIVGAGMQTHPGVAAGMFEALYNVGVNIRMIGTSEIRVTVLVDEKDVDKAMRAAHDKFIED